MPEHLFLDKGQQLALLIDEGVDGLIIGKGFVEEYLDDVGAWMLHALLMRFLIEVDDLVLAGVQVATVILRKFQLSHLNRE